MIKNDSAQKSVNNLQIVVISPTEHIHNFDVIWWYLYYKITHLPILHHLFVIRVININVLCTLYDSIDGIPRHNQAIMVIVVTAQNIISFRYLPRHAGIRLDHP